MHEISINNGSFLWMTRGQKWEFRFLSKCSLLASAVETVYKTVFLPDESRFGYWKGHISVDGAQKPYVACRCYDSMVQRDDAGRRIPHEFLLLCSEEEYSLLNGLAWESLILDQVRGLYAERYPCPANEVTDCLIDLSIQLNQGIASTESCVSLDIPISPPTPKQHPTWHPSIGVFFAILFGFCAGYLFMARQKTEKTGIAAVESSVDGQEKSECEVVRLNMTNLGVEFTVPIACSNEGPKMSSSVDLNKDGGKNEQEDMVEGKPGMIDGEEATNAASNSIRVEGELTE